MVGGTLTCVADANPQVSSLDYQWTVRQAGGQTSTEVGPMLTLLPSHEGSREIQCCATNEYREDRHTGCSEFKTFDVQGKWHVWEKQPNTCHHHEQQ